MPQVRCSMCHRPFDPEKSEALPFCSPRCKQIDLGRWLDERYTLPVKRLDESSEEGRPSDEID